MLIKRGDCMIEDIGTCITFLGYDTLIELHSHSFNNVIFG